MAQGGIRTYLKTSNISQPKCDGDLGGESPVRRVTVIETEAKNGWMGELRWYAWCASIVAPTNME